MATPTLTLPGHLVRWFLAPAAVGLVAALGAVFASLASVLRRAREPALPRMSHEWLHGHDRENGKYVEHWR